MGIWAADLETLRMIRCLEIVLTEARAALEMARRVPSRVLPRVQEKPMTRIVALERSPQPVWMLTLVPASRSGDLRR
jgi:hypothetical protein